jgi:uncharacterized protein
MDLALGLAINTDNLMDDELKKEYTDLLIFVKKNTEQFDESHNYQHAISVYINAIIISKNTPYNKRVIMYAAMLHDVCDHKYSEAMPFEELEKFIHEKLNNEEAFYVIEIIKNVSYSKEIAGKRSVLPEPYNHILDIVSDADRLEAIGYTGISRCFKYTKSKNYKLDDNKIMDLVIHHCFEKLLKLYKQNYIKTDVGRKIAKPLHDEIIKFIKTTLRLII